MSLQKRSVKLLSFLPVRLVMSVKLKMLNQGIEEITETESFAKEPKFTKLL